MKPSSSPFSIAERLKSFQYAFAGIIELLHSQHNARIHLLATIIVVLAGVWFELTQLEWALVLLACAMVWCAEALNTAVEFLADAAVPEQHPLIKKAKDVAAAAVLLVAMFAVLIAGLVFLPHL